MPNPPDEVRGTPEFVAFFRSLRRGSYLHKATKEAIDVLCENMLAGEKVEKKKWPQVYVEKYGIRNLFLMDLGRRFRVVRNASLFRPTEIEGKRYKLDCSRAQQTLGWHPKYSLKDGLEQTFRFACQRKVSANGARRK